MRETLRILHVVTVGQVERGDAEQVFDEVMTSIGLLIELSLH